MISPDNNSSEEDAHSSSADQPGQQQPPQQLPQTQQSNTAQAADFDFTGEAASNWFNVRVIRVNKGSHMLHYKQRYSDMEFSEINMMQVGKARFTRVIL